MQQIEEVTRSMLSFLPAFLPDETLYSLCARYHNLSGNRLAARTSTQLFGVETAAALHDFPAHLAQFAMRTEKRLGDAATLARSRTLMRFYMPYQPVDRINAGIQAMAGAGIERLKFRMGLPSSRMGASHPLKACVKCIKEEVDLLGCAYWHLQQQHPAVWVCPKHGQLLMRSIGKSRVRNKLQWILPHTLSKDDWTPLPQDLMRQSLLLQRLQQLAWDSSGIDVPHLDQRILRQCYLWAVKRSGWLTKNGSVRLRAVREAFLDRVIGLRDIPEFSFVESASGASGGFVGILLRNPRAHLHPAKHLIFKSFLFDSWAEFWSSYLEMSAVSQGLNVRPYNNSCDRSKIEDLISMVETQKKSLAEVARNLELPYDVARYWLRRAKVRYAS